MQGVRIKATVRIECFDIWHDECPLGLPDQIFGPQPLQHAIEMHCGEANGVGEVGQIGMYAESTLHGTTCSAKAW